jgi:hypothetical protein
VSHIMLQCRCGFNMHIVAVECYIMQGKYPLPQQVIQKFAKTGGELCSNVFLLGDQSSYFEREV